MNRMLSREEALEKLSRVAIINSIKSITLIAPDMTPASGKSLHSARVRRRSENFFDEASAAAKNLRETCKAKERRRLQNFNKKKAA